MNKKGFTLIELLLVIGILAILSAVVVLVLNPAQLFAQARDSQRMGDLAAVRDSVIFYLTTSSDTPTFTVGPFSTASSTCGFGSCTPRDIYAVDGTGWVGVDLTGSSGGSPLAKLPQDPNNTGDYQYAYKGNDTYKTFELNARLESLKYRDIMVDDGGNKNDCTALAGYLDTDCYYEIGTDPDLDL